MSLTGISAAEFVITADSGEALLTPAASRSPTIVFDPFTLGAKATNLELLSDDVDESVVNVALTWTGERTSCTLLAVHRDKLPGRQPGHHRHRGFPQQQLRMPTRVRVE